jgi:hypothetical protein
MNMSEQLQQAAEAKANELYPEPDPCAFRTEEAYSMAATRNRHRAEGFIDCAEWMASAAPVAFLKWVSQRYTKFYEDGWVEYGPIEVDKKARYTAEQLWEKYSESAAAAPVGEAPQKDGENYGPGTSNTDVAPVASHSSGSGNAVEQFTPPDHGEECWPMGAETYTRKEVAYLLYTQRAMISNDLKAHCGHDLTPGMYQILKQPRTPQY